MSNAEILKNQKPTTGRIVRENGELFNIADHEYLLNLAAPYGHAFRKRAFFYNQIFYDFPNNSTKHVSLTASLTKHTVFYAREIKASEGRVDFNIIISPSSFAQGTPAPITPFFVGGPAPDMVITHDPTAIVGGVSVPADVIWPTGNNTANSAIASGGFPTIFPPGVELIAEINFSGSGVADGIQFTLSFAEIEIPEGII